MICKYPGCSKYFVNPVILNCGQTVCHEHIDDMLTNNVLNKCYICKLCNFEHEIPTHGFIKNKIVAEMINESNHLTKDQKKIKDMLEGFQENIKKLKGIIADPSNYLYDYMAELKRLVDLQREELKKQVDEICLKIIEEIDRLYKEAKECLDKLDKKDMKVDFEKYNKIVKYSEEYIRLREYDEKKMQDVVERAEKMNKESQEKLDSFELKLLNNKTCKFEPNKNSIHHSIVGLFLIESKKEI